MESPAKERLPCAYLSIFFMRGFSLAGAIFQYLAAFNAKPFIGAYVAHGGIRPECDKEVKIFPQEKELDLFLVKQQSLPFLAQKELKNGQCRKFSHGIACMKGSTSRWWDKKFGT